MPKRPAHRCRRRPGFFHPVPLRERSDGWSEARQCEFLAQLYFTGSVTAAARGIGKSRASAYRLRARAGAESFAHAWDRVLMPPGSGRERTRFPPQKIDWRKVTYHELVQRLETGLIQPVIYRGRMTAIRRKSDNSVLFRLLRRGDAMRARSGSEGRSG